MLDSPFTRSLDGDFVLDLLLDLDLLGDLDLDFDLLGDLDLDLDLLEDLDLELLDDLALDLDFDLDLDLDRAELDSSPEELLTDFLESASESEPLDALPRRQVPMTISEKNTFEVKVTLSL